MEKFTVNWKLKSRRVPLAHAAAMTNFDQGTLRRILTNGVLGSPPDELGPNEVTLLHLASALALKHGTAGGQGPAGLMEALPQLAAAAYVQLALMELAERRWQTNGVPAACCSELAHSVRRGDGQTLVEDKLGFSGASTKRFGFLVVGKLVTSNDPELAVGQEGSGAILFDACEIARRMKAHLPGPLFHGQIGLWE